MAPFGGLLRQNAQETTADFLPEVVEKEIDIPRPRSSWKQTKDDKSPLRSGSMLHAATEDLVPFTASRIVKPPAVFGIAGIVARALLWSVTILAFAPACLLW